MSSAKPNKNGLWAGLLVEELCRQGCTMFFISPGSRSSPLVQEIARNSKTTSCIHYDERGGAFAALGYSRLAETPAVWVTTSGTAVSNGLPAVVEASIDRVPLILLTADRPPELRDTSANQAIRQPSIFGNNVRWHFDMPAPSEDVNPAFVLTTVDHAVFQASEEAGPVHLNCMFREPLAYQPATISEGTSSVRIRDWYDSDDVYTSFASGSRVGSATNTDHVEKLISASKRPILVLGRLSESGYGDAAVRWAERSNVPVFPDILSGYRLGKSESSLIPLHDLLIAGSYSTDGALQEIPDALRPDLIIQLGKSPVSKRVLGFIQNSGVSDYILIDEGPDRIDPLHLVSNRFRLDDDGVENLFSKLESSVKEPAWLGVWKQLNIAAQDDLRDFFESDVERGLSEQGLVRRLCSIIPKDHVLVVASSLPVRHIDSFASMESHPVHVVANRGASGIDGTIAMAVGTRLASGKNTTCLIGDLALLHDLNSLKLAADHGLTIVVINNDGGGIFSYLPIENQSDVFETFFTTPHGLQFEAAAKMFGLTYSAPTDTDALLAAYTDARSSTEGAIIELNAERGVTKRINNDVISQMRKVVGSTIESKS